MGFEDFLSLIDASYIYEGGKNLALFVASVITPFLLVIAIWLRLASNQLSVATSGQGKWAEFFKDLAVWVTILGLYFVLASMLSDLFNSMYSYFHERGSLGAILAQFADMIDQIDAAGEDAELLSQSMSILTSPVTFVVWLFYYFSFLVATIVIKFLKLAHAICWSFALIWGLIAIPMSITSNFKLLRGWGIFSAIALLWPIIHFSGFALFNPIFENAANAFIAGTGAGTVSIDKAQLYIIMTIVNVIAVALAIAAPYITAALVSNSGSIAGVVMPFASAAVATAAAATAKYKVAMQASGGVAGKVGTMAATDLLQGKSPLSRVSDTIRSVKQSITGQSSGPSVGANQAGAGSRGFSPAVGESSAIDAPKKPTAKAPSIAQASTAASALDTSAAMSSVPDTTDGLSEPTESESKPARSKASQQRRGAILNQVKNNMRAKP